MRYERYSLKDADLQPKRRSLFARVLLFLLVLILLLVLLAAGIWWGLRHRMRTSLAPLDGTLHLPGLSAPVTVLRDAHGVPHIEAANLHDLLMAQGWVTASDRLWQMDMARRLPAGEAAEVLGEKLVPHDRAERTLGLRDVAERMSKSMPPDQLAQLEAYAAGVNAYIQHGVLPAEFTLLLYKPKPWRPEDSILVALSMAETLDQRWQSKVKREQVTARLEQHGFGLLAADLYPVGSWRDHPPVPTAPPITDQQPAAQTPPGATPGSTPPNTSPNTTQSLLKTPLLPARDLLALAAMGEDTECRECRAGSNEWAVSGARTASGKPLLSNDMHLDHQIPNTWYESDLHAGSFHVAGVTIPGLPFIAAGHNDHIAWGFTAMGGDTQDVYVEKVNGQDQYEAFAANGATSWQPIQHEKERIRVRGGRDVSLDVERTAHGPIISSLLPDERRTLSLRWTIYETAAQGLPLYALDSANDWTSFRAALAHWWAPTLNVAYADDAGHIGYQAAGLIPIRSGGLQAVPVQVGGQPPAPVSAQPAQPAPAAAPGAPLKPTDAQSPLNAMPPPPPPKVVAAPPSLPAGEWTGTIPFNAMPSVLDPASGIVATANSRITPDGYPYQISLDWADPYRNQRIWKALETGEGLTPLDLLTLQNDVFSESDQAIAQRLAYAVDHASSPSDRAKTAADILRSWNGVLSIDSPAAAIVTTAERNFWPIVLGAKIGPAWRLYDWNESAFAREQMIAEEPPEWLPPAYSDWNNFLASLVDSAVKNAPGNLRSRRYGDSHKIEIQHPLWKYMPFLDSGVGPLPLSGDHSTIRQSTGNLGPSQRFTADLGDLDHSTENILTGQSGDPLSALYRDQWPFWYDGRSFDLPFSQAAVQGAAGHTLRLEP